MRKTKTKQPDVEKLPEWDDLMKRFLNRLPVEERLEGLAPEERLEGLAPEEVVLALPQEHPRT